MICRLDDLARRFRGGLESVTALAAKAAPPLVRLALALPFLRSGLTRWDGPGGCRPARSISSRNSSGSISWARNILCRRPIFWRG